MKLTKPFYMTMGWISLLLGIIGAFLPLLPTTPFLILSSYCFSKSSKRMHIWLTTNPYFGSVIIDWEQNKVIRPKAKTLAILMLWILLGLSITFGKLNLALKVMLMCIGLSVSLFIYTRKSRV